MQSLLIILCFMFLHTEHIKHFGVRPSREHNQDEIKHLVVGAKD